MNRRDFMKTAAVGVAGIASGTPVLNRTLREFSYADVTLTGGPLKRQHDQLRAHYLSLDNDRLLKVYRQRAGLPAPGEDMGGWYDADGFVPGHSLGQYISGLSRYYQSTKDEACAQKVRALVKGYAATLGTDGYPYASEKAATTWPCYVLDKYEAGLIDAYRLAGDQSAREILEHVIGGATPHIPDHTYDRTPNSPKQAPYDEPYILPENLFNTYELTGGPKYLAMARLYLLNHEYFDPLAQNRNVLPGKHAYSHMIALSSAARAYEVLGEVKYLDAIRNAWDMIQQTQQFASGGWGPKEAFVEPHQGKLGKSLTTTRDHFETPCGAYAHTKLARYLLRFTGESRYGDGLERIVYNALLASRDPGSDGEYFYYSDYQSLAKKGYYKRKWPCCSGTLIQSVADYPVDIYFRGPNALYINLYTPSQVRWMADRTPVTVSQESQYPDDGEIELRVSVPHPIQFAVNLRIPGWLKSNARISVNGKSLAVPATPGTFASINRKWHGGDVVHLSLPLDFRVEPVDDWHPDRVALIRGAQMMVAVNPSATLADTPLTLPGKMTPIPYRASGFSMELATGVAEFQPFHSIQDEVYTTYFRRTATP
jgi:hypothetical protein